MSVIDAYRAALADGTHEADPSQADAAQALADLEARLLKDRVWERRLRAAIGLGRHQSPVEGLYLWGGVGRGKTWLMDLFFTNLPIADKRRVHFHRFLREIHRALRRLGERRDPLQRIAADIAADTRVLCFDELFVSDIGDAMILGTLFEALFERGVTVVATSNLPPSELYRDGLQRARFLPAIAAIERHMRVFELTAGTDFRLRALSQAALYRHPAGETADASLAEDFRRVAGTHGEADCSLDVEGRTLPTRRCADGVVWFTFDALCSGPRGPSDYIEIAHDFHTVLVSGVPRMDETMENEARRFVTLVDEFYDRRVKLILSATVPLLELYGGDRLRFEFQRTTSRLQEMQTHDYLGEPHLG
ncbi:MAG: cell division protein ZapE [Gammaproteobacteria bacterium]